PGRLRLADCSGGERLAPREVAAPDELGRTAPRGEPHESARWVRDGEREDDAGREREQASEHQMPRPGAVRLRLNRDSVRGPGQTRVPGGPDVVTAASRVQPAAQGGAVHEHAPCPDYSGRPRGYRPVLAQPVSDVSGGQ